MNLAVIDTSAWISYFRGDGSAVRRIDPVLADGTAAVTGPIVAEVLSGAATRAEFEHLRELFRGLERLADPPELWDRVAEARYALARKGHQGALVDLAIAVTCHEGGDRLVTRDRGFRAIARVIPIELQVF
ncbi:MAG TPA: PIN domain-containing protein [Thermoanaerobaculia bacterium]|nr:PIN domain-containing protein [Thermoanaerobaculia bacterium]